MDRLKGSGRFSFARGWDGALTRGAAAKSMPPAQSIIAARIAASILQTVQRPMPYTTLADLRFYFLFLTYLYMNYVRHSLFSLES